MAWSRNASSKDDYKRVNGGRGIRSFPPLVPSVTYRKHDRPVKAERVKRHRAGTRQARAYSLSMPKNTCSHWKKLERELQKTMQEIDRLDRLLLLVIRVMTGGLPLGVLWHRASEQLDRRLRSRFDWVRSNNHWECRFDPPPVMAVFNLL